MDSLGLIKGFIIAIDVVFIVYGLVHIFMKDWAWKLAVLSNSLQGRKSERTRAWEVGATVQGVLIIASALIVLFLLSRVDMLSFTDLK